jgi:peptide/nickel transport system permease protein
MTELEKPAPTEIGISGQQLFKYDDIQGQAPLRLAWRRLRRHRLAMVGLVVIVLFILAAIFAPIIAPHNPDQSSLRGALAPPSAEHWLGQDELGRDLLSRIIFGARISLMIGLISVSIGLAVGVPLGLVSGYFGGIIDLVIQRVMDVLLAFPGILLAIIFVATLGIGLVQVMIAVGISSVPVYARLVRGSALAAKEELYVDAVRALGGSDFLILSRHIFPNVLSPIIVQSTLQIAAAILTAAGLGFLGLGAPPNVPEWGTMLSRGRTWVFSAPHATIFPGLAIMFVVLGFNLLGDGLNDALDPRMKNS